MVVNSKTCKKCGYNKPFSDYRGHVRGRYGLYSRCKSCDKEDKREWYDQGGDIWRSSYQKKRRDSDIENRRRLDRKYYKKTKKERLVYNKRWRDKNPDKVKDQRKRDREKHPERFLAKEARRRSRRRGLESTLTKDEWIWLVLQSCNCCVYCGSLSDNLEMEHVVPVCQGGGSTLENIRPSCRPCNLKKGGRTPDQAEMPIVILIDVCLYRDEVGEIP